jgi:hypothetical protein
MELLLPGLAYIDFVGEPTEEVADPPGMLLLRPEETRFLGRTGFVGPCDRFELAAAGGSEADRRELLLSTAKGFAFDPSLGVTDCGPLSDASLKEVRGDNAMAAISTLEPGGLFLSPLVGGGGPTDLRIRPDGRCDVVVESAGGIKPTVIVSGDEGTYGLDTVRGFAPDGLDINSSGTVQLDPSASVKVNGTAFSVAVDYWCGDCARAVMTLHYPGDDITATAELDGPGAFTGDLPIASTPGSYGWITIVWSSGVGDGRGVWTTNVTSGDFSAG